MAGNQKRRRSRTWQHWPECRIGTVSKAVNGTGQLRAQTRDRVLAAADR